MLWITKTLINRSICFLDIIFIFGAEIGLTVTMTSYVTFTGDPLDDQPLDAYQLFTVGSDFFSAATLSNIEELDATRALIDFDLVAVSGEQTFE